MEKSSVIVERWIGIGNTWLYVCIELIPSFSIEGLNPKGILLDVAICLTWVGYLIVGQSIMKKYKPLTIVFYDFLQVFVYVSLFQSPMTTFSEVTFNRLLGPYISVGKVLWYLCYWIGQEHRNQYKYD